ncbi:hypothetical protein LGM85_30210 [Burkholderia multivorans]|uniref:hypothetical protein n=1 Tax=Burkholderia multivorans TaxID=87883 RepID=UPI00201A9EA9|nr:hypothetical protein [Burkholderia multivorans]MCA8488199.1 hypothetical protein [Burkholderia multivorans]MCL4663305.1 hypothetical protein [Burkholderia multivorans]MCO1414983.1 hypothetical protein [Burkholderia multivorans]MCO1448926.1 hypothetical protein [Burkholderia multivorans]MCO8315272.1 hypothetical protein [Burkholderia multivorans]
MSHGDWDKDLVAMRTRYWAREVKKAAGFEGKKNKDFVDACRFGNTKLADLGGMTWEGYLAGKKNPVYKSVDAVEKVLPGTAVSFYKGPKGLELWNILSGNTNAAQELLDSTLEAEYGSGSGNTVSKWDLGQKVFWLVLSILAFPLAPFVEQMTRESLIREGEKLPWSDIQSLVDRGTINIPMDGGEIRLASLLAACDDTRKIYTLDSTFSTFGPRLVSYAFERHSSGAVDLGFSPEFIVAALGLLPLAEAASNNRLAHIAKVLNQGLILGVIGYEMPDVQPDLESYVQKRLI